MLVGRLYIILCLKLWCYNCLWRFAIMRKPMIDNCY
nr:MAG TPA: hypothetical protein [Caudoviricetes sp.]